MEDFDVTLEILKQSYANEQDNPLHVWEAILYCLTEKTEEVPMPPWVKVYLEEVAEDLLAIKKVLKKGGEELKNALKISDLRVFANHVGAREKKLIFQKVNHEMQKSDRPVSLEGLKRQLSVVSSQFSAKPSLRMCRFY